MNRIGLTSAFLGVLLVCCGKAPSTPAPIRGEVVAYLVSGDSLRTSRLPGAGCIQVVENSDGGKVAEFSTQDCPPDVQALLPIDAVAFSLDVEETANQIWLLRSEGVLVGDALEPKAEKEGMIPKGSILHLCQISDPQAFDNRVFAEVCEIVFHTEFGPNEGRYLALQVRSVEDIASSKVRELNSIKRDELTAKESLLKYVQSQEISQRELERARKESDEAREQLIEAQRVVRDSQTSNQTVHRKLVKETAEAELKAAVQNVQYIEMAIRFASAQQRKAAVLKERLEGSDRAKQRKAELEKAIEDRKKIYTRTDDMQTLTTILEQNNKLVLTDESRRQIEEEIAFSMAEAAKLENLENVDHPAALEIVIAKRNALARLEGLPSPTEVEEDSEESIP